MRRAHAIGCLALCSAVMLFGYSNCGEMHAASLKSGVGATSESAEAQNQRRSELASIYIDMSIEAEQLIEKRLADLQALYGPLVTDHAKLAKSLEDLDAQLAASTDSDAAQLRIALALVKNNDAAIKAMLENSLQDRVDSIAELGDEYREQVEMLETQLQELPRLSEADFLGFKLAALAMKEELANTVQGSINQSVTDKLTFAETLTASKVSFETLKQQILSAVAL